MQTTLLGLAITFIIALIAALIGPYFIDWNRLRPQFEAEAARMLGAPVRVDGALVARLLPSPSLRLRSVVVGGPNDPGKVRADNLAVEFSLGSLMRGEWRATELTINGVALDVGLDAGGRIDWPLSSRLNFGSVSIDRLNLTGRVALHDAASRSTLELNDIAFSGDVRSLGTSVRGDGNFMLSGVRHPFRISSGQASDGNASRVHVAVDPGSRAASIDLDGILSFDARVPHFEGALTLAGAMEFDSKESSDATAQRPWRVSTKVKADPGGARLEQVDASYGESSSSLKLAGVGDVRFGASPRIHAELFARQLDADRLLAKDQDSPSQMLPALQGLLTKIPQPWLATDVGISADQIMLGGRPIQNFGADLRGDAASWAISRLEFRAPGAARVTMNGQIAEPGPTAHFNGALDIESSDPDTFVAWLQGRSEVIHQSRKPLRLRGNLTLDSSRVAFDELKADIEGSSVEGRLAFVNSTAGKGARAEAELRADRLDLDAAASLVRAIAGPQGGWPDEGQLSLNVDRAMSAGQELRPFVAKLAYGPKAFSLEQLKIGSPGGLTIEGSGAFDRVNATGQLSLNAASDSFAQMTSLITPVMPAVAARLDAMPSAPGAAQLKLTLNLDNSHGDKNKADATAKLDVGLPQLKGIVSMAAALPLAAVRSIDLDALARSEVTVQAKLSGEPGNALLDLLGLDRMVATGNGSALFEGKATGVWNAPIRLNAKMSGTDLDAAIKGTMEPWSSDRKADFDLTVRRVDLGPLLRSSDSHARNVSLSSHVTLAGSKLIFNDLDGTAAGARMRGHVAVNFGNENVVEGDIGMDTFDLASAFGLAIGATGHDASEPLGGSLPKGWRGQLAFEALRGVLPGGVELRPVSGIVKGDDQSLTFVAMKGKIGDGDATARLDIRKAVDGVALKADVQLTNVDGAALHYGALAMPAGRASAQITLASQGRSASALVGALSGSGLVTLERARIPGLDPRVFDVALNASDDGQTSDDTKLQQIVEQSLSASPLPVASVQIPFNVRDGRLRVSTTTLDGDGAQAVVSGGYDIAADQVDIRASLASTSAGSANNRPEVQIFAVGPPSAINRTTDVAALSSWLAVRAIDRETRRLDSIEQRMTPSPVPPPATPLPATASLSAESSEVSATPLATDDPPLANAPVPKRDPRRSRAQSRMAASLPATNSLSTESSEVSAAPLATDDPPLADVPVPKRDPRRFRAKPRMATQARSTAAPQAFNAPIPPWLARLQAPFATQPARTSKPVRRRQPLVLRPSASTPSRPAF
ncbi:MAG: AsmA-like C-terminal region-containing protein [Nitrobacter sp.]